MYLTIYIISVIISYYAIRYKFKKESEWGWSVFFMTLVYSIFFPILGIILIYTIFALQNLKISPKPSKWP